MRKTEAKDWMGQHSSPTLTRAARLSAVVLGVGLLVASGAARAQEADDEDKTFEEKIIEGIMKGIGGTNMDNTGIDYRERSPLVVPPKLDLPQPAASSTDVKAPNWPKDPDEARRKAAGTSGGTKGSDSAVPGGDPGRNALLTPSELGFEGRFSNLFGGNKTEIKEFKAEPPRDSLTQPPPGYQTPSSNFAYGTGPKESLNKEYNPAAGKYGE